MKLKAIELKNFRNYEELKLDFHPNLNIFLGQNAQGKTNILEAIHFLALTRSHRTSHDKELISWSQQEMKVSGVVEKAHATVPLEVQLSPKGRIAKANHLKENRLADYIGQLKILMFAPENLELVKGSPATRRKFMDIELGQIHAVYLYDSMRYNRALKERNAYLKFDKDKIFNASTCGDNCAKWLLKIAESEDRTINLLHLMDFGPESFSIHILNTNQIVHSMEELVSIAGEFV